MCVAMSSVSAVVIMSGVRRHRAPPSTGIVISGNVRANEQCAPNVLSEIPVVLMYSRARVPSPGVLAPLVGVADVHVAVAALLLPGR